MSRPRFMKLWKYNFLPTGGLQRLALLVLYCLLPSVVLANTDYYRHVVFDNSLPSETYFYSEGSANGPSFLEQKNWHLPVETKTFLTPPNAIRLQWESQPGGGWEAEVRVVNFRNRLPEFSGHNLYLWCFAPQAISANHPRCLSVSNKSAGVAVLQIPEALSELLR